MSAFGVTSDSSSLSGIVFRFHIYADAAQCSTWSFMSLADWPQKLKITDAERDEGTVGGHYPRESIDVVPVSGSVGHQGEVNVASWRRWLWLQAFDGLASGSEMF
jgi:hypothetical protein